MPKTVTADQKLAMKEGRRDSGHIDAYLKAIARPKPRGRPDRLDQLAQRLNKAQAEAASSEGIARLKSLQTAADLQHRIDSATAGNEEDTVALESAFVDVAARYSERHGISYATWREAGVPASMLKRAGVRQTRRRR